MAKILAVAIHLITFNRLPYLIFFRTHVQQAGSLVSSLVSFFVFVFVFCGLNWFAYLTIWWPFS